MKLSFRVLKDLVEKLELLDQVETRENKVYKDSLDIQEQLVTKETKDQ